MASKKYQEIKELSEADLHAELVDVEKQFQSLRFDHAVTGLDNPMVIKEMRRDVARLKTEVRRRQLGAASATELAGRSKIRARRRKRK